MDEATYIKKRDYLLARIAELQRACEEREAFAEKMKAKADALEKVCEEQDRYKAELQAELKAKLERIKRDLGIIQ